jgi:hypothetical protein
MINVREKIETIVNSIRSSGSVISITINLDGTYTIFTKTTGNLQSSFKVLLMYTDSSQNRDVYVDSVDSNSFTFSSQALGSPVAWQMSLYYEYGTRAEMNQKYINKGKAANKLISEYPFFWLYTPISEQVNLIEPLYTRTTIRGSIVNQSRRDMYEENRINQKFKPVLYPYFELRIQLLR